ncbi:MAG: YgiQ family radical SAM protein, partial [Ruthenibacterium sp.]
MYTQMAKQAYPDLPVILGGLEASLRRFAHYDYWSDTVMPSVLQTSGADLVSFGMSEHQTAEIARRLALGERASDITNVAGTCFLTDFFALPEHYAECASFAKVSADKMAYAKACRIQMDNQDPVTGKPVVQKQGEKYLVQNLPAMPLTRSELDALYALPFTRRWHPSYAAFGGIPAIEEVEFSIIQNRGCFGGCNFCAIQLHQGRRVTSRSADSVVAEAELITKAPGFKGYIHDIGGPTANFRLPSCKQQMTKGMCMGGKHCLAPQPCGNLIVDHSEYLGILRRVRALPGIKKV